MREGRRVAIYTSSNKQKLIENMIQKQYDQLLEICEQTKAGVAYLSKDIDETDFSRSLEIEKTQALIASIEQDIQAKKQHVYDMEIKNRYQQLFSVYETTKKEVAILENLLQNNDLGKVDHVRTIHDYDLFLNGINSDDILTSNQLPEPKRERLNLRSSTAPNLSRTLDSEYDDMVVARLERLENIAFMLDKQTTHTTHRFDAETKMEEPAIPEVPEPTLIVPEASESIPIVPEISDAPEPTPIVPEISDAPEPTPIVPEIPDAPEPTLIVPEIPEAPEPTLIVPEVPVAPIAPEMPEPTLIVPEVPVAPIAPEMPKNSKLKAEIKKQSKSNGTNQPKKKATKKKISEKKEHSALSIFFNVIFYFVLVFSIVFVMLFGNQNPQAIPRNVMGFSVMRVATSSMEPNIPVNSLIVTRTTNPNDLQIDDVVTYGRANNTTLTHRIYEIEEDHTPGTRGFVLKGDALAAPDPEVAAGQNIIGRVIFISYPLGRALMFFQNQFWFVITLVVLILIVLFVLQGLFKTKKQVSKKKPSTKPKAKK